LSVAVTGFVLAYYFAVAHNLLSVRKMAPIFQRLLIVDDFKTAWLTFGICILAAAWKRPAPILKVADFMGSHIIATVAGTIGLLGAGALFVYKNSAFCMDEYAAVFQAKTFATGRIIAQLPPTVIDWLIPPGFNGAFLVASRTTGRAIEVYWPGFSLILAPFEFAGIPWLCNASLAGLAIYLVHRITLEITNDRRAAGWAVLFTVGSGAFAAYAISYYSMQAHLTANLLFVWLLLKPTSQRAFWAGVVGSVALVLHNPFPHTMFAAPWIIAIARSKERRQSLLTLLLGYLPVSIFVGIGWLNLRDFVTSGDAGLSAISSTISTAFSFPTKSMLYIRLAETAKLWIWEVPCLLVLAGFGRLRNGDDWRICAMTQSALLTFVGYVFFTLDQGHGWGYRYFHSAWGVVPILAASAMAARSQPNGRLVAFAGATTILNLVLVLPLQLIQIQDIITGHAAQLPPRKSGNNVYFICDGGFYLADLVQADPLLRAEDLFLFSRGPILDAELRRQNWPTAVLVERRPGVEEWNIGSGDQRKYSNELPGTKRLVFEYSERTPTSGISTTDTTMQVVPGK
jgi:hypothetical protein